MNEVRVPGKVMLSGEYAVLYGGTAVLVPVPSYVRVAVADTPPDFAPGPAAQSALDFPVPELAAFESEHGKPVLAVDNREFYNVDENGTWHKLGLGASAAEAVGVLALRFQLAGLNWREHRLRIARLGIAVHRQAQDGLGSGADVAACAMGERIRYRQGEGNGVIERIGPVPAGAQIPLALVWTGRPADTREMVEQWQAWLSHADPKVRSRLDKLIGVSNMLAESWFTSSTGRLFALLDEFDAELSQVMSMAGVAYRLPIHDELSEWAMAYGGRAKPTGAGGGDMALLLGELPLRELSRRGMQVIEL
jgi:phosphomevalonate kinase